MKNKIVHITTVHKRYDSRIFYKECSSLAKAGFEVFLIVADNFMNEVITLDRSSAVTIIDVGSFKNRFQRIFGASERVLKIALEINAQVYHFHDPELLPLALKLKKKNKIVVFDSHEDIFANIKEKAYIPNILKPIISFLLTLVETYVLKRIDGVISVTPHICNKLRKLNKNTVMITNYPILGERKSENFNRKKSLVFAGGVMNQWKHEFVLDALALCEDKEVVYNLCGPTYTDYMESLTQHKSWSRVNYYGILNKQEVDKIYNESSIGIATLIYGKNVGGKLGSIGNTKLFEYMAAEIPFICTDFVLWKEIVDKYDCGICVEPTNAEQIAKAIDFLISNPQKRDEMGRNGRKAVEEVYNWKNQELTLFDFYNKLLTHNK